MTKLIAVFVSLIGMLGLLIPQNVESNISSDKARDYVNHQSDEKTMIKPEALAPTYEIHNSNSDNIFINMMGTMFLLMKLF